MFFPFDMEGIIVELNFRICKWLLFVTYHPPFQADIYYFDNLDKALTRAVVMKNAYLEEILTRKNTSLV